MLLFSDIILQFFCEANSKIDQIHLNTSQFPADSIVMLFYVANIFPLTIYITDTFSVQINLYFLIYLFTEDLL